MPAREALARIAQHEGGEAIAGNLLREAAESGAIRTRARHVLRGASLTRLANVQLDPTDWRAAVPNWSAGSFVRPHYNRPGVGDLPHVEAHGVVFRTRDLAHEFPAAFPAAAETVEERCQQWLAALMAASPERRPKAKAAFMAEYRHVEAITNAAFLAAWKRAIAATGANWNKPGRS